MNEEMEDSLIQDENGVKETITRMKTLLKSVFKTLFTFFKWFITFLVSNFYLVLIIAIILIIILVAFGAVSYAYSGGYDSENGLMTSFDGIKGDKFYGTRVVYFDESYTTNNLKKMYLEFTDSIVKDLSNYGISLSLTLNEVENYTTTFALKLANKSSGNLTDCVSIINHYGFDNTTIINDSKTEQDIVLESIASSIKSKNNALDYANILSSLKSSYDSNFAYMKNVCSKILIKDYILEPTERLKDLPKQNYVSYIYMQNQDVNIESANFIFATGENNTVDIKAVYKSNALITIKEEQADSSWFKNNEAQLAMQCDLTNCAFTEFTAIDKDNLNYLSNGKTLFEIYKDGMNTVIFNDNINANNVDDILANFKSDNYFYLSLNAQEEYNMIDIATRYE